MPIFHRNLKKKVFFAHVPKTGGTYVEDLFRQNGFEVLLWYRSPEKVGMYCSPQHFHADLYRHWINLDAFERSFITVRHPVDRLLSEYRDRTKRKYVRLTTWLERARVKFRDDPFANDNHLRPQVEFLDSSLKVYRQEDGFDEKWAQELNKSFNLNFTVFSTERRRNTELRQGPLTPEERAAVIAFCEEFYQEDLVTFDYRLNAARGFGPVRSAPPAPIPTTLRTRLQARAADMKRARIARMVNTTGRFPEAPPPSGDLTFSRHKNAGVAPTIELARNEINQALRTLGVHRQDGSIVEDSLLVRFGCWRNVPGRFEPKHAINASVIYGGHLFDHFGHFLLEGLSRMWAANEFPEHDIVWSVRPKRESTELETWQRELLDGLIGPRKHFLVSEDTSFRQVVVPTQGYRIDDFFAPRHEEFLARFGQAHEPVRGTKLWLSRRDVDVKRGLLNVLALERHLSRSGWRVWSPERVGIRQQIETMAAAERIAGEEGSALHTLIFLNDPQRLAVDILPRWGQIDRFRPNYELIAAVKGFRQNLHSVSGERLLSIKGMKSRRIAKNFVEHLDALSEPVIHDDIPARSEFPGELLDGAATIIQFGGGATKGLPLATAGLWLVTEDLGCDPRRPEIDREHLYEMSAQHFFRHFSDERPRPDAVVIAEPTSEEDLARMLACLGIGGRVVVCADEPKLVEAVGRFASDTSSRRNGWIAMNLTTVPQIQTSRRKGRKSRAGTRPG